MFSIVKHPARTLHQPCDDVTQFGDSLHALAEEMNKTMISSNGIGLAAPQIGKNIKFVIVKVGDEGSEYAAYVNPVITFRSAKKVSIEEGCLSLPGLYGYVTRAAKIRVKYQNVRGEKKIEKLTGMPAIILQHEIDHINSKLIIDRDIHITKGEKILRS